MKPRDPHAYHRYPDKIMRQADMILGTCKLTRQEVIQYFERRRAYAIHPDRLIIVW